MRPIIWGVLLIVRRVGVAVVCWAGLAAGGLLVAADPLDLQLIEHWGRYSWGSTSFSPVGDFTSLPPVETIGAEPSFSMDFSQTWGQENIGKNTFAGTATATISHESVSGTIRDNGNGTYDLELSGPVVLMVTITGRLSTTGLSKPIAVASQGRVASCDHPSDGSFYYRENHQTPSDVRLTVSCTLQEYRLNVTHEIGPDGTSVPVFEFAPNFSITMNTNEGIRDMRLTFYGGFRFGLGSKDLAVGEVEFIQVTQDANRSVPLVAGKPTMVRVFPKIYGAEQIEKVDGKVCLAGQPSRCVNRSLNGPITAVKTPSRTAEDHSLNFLLPPDWVSQKGQLTVNAEVWGPPEFLDANPVNNTKQGFATVIESPVLNIAYIRLCLKPGQKVCPESADLHVADALARTMFPVAPQHVEYFYLGEMTWQSSFDNVSKEEHRRRSWRLLFDLSKAVYQSNLDGPFDQVFAWLPDTIVPNPHGYGRVGYFPETLADLPLIAPAMSLAYVMGRNFGLSACAVKASEDAGVTILGGSSVSFPRRGTVSTSEGNYFDALWDLDCYLGSLLSLSSDR